MEKAKFEGATPVEVSREVFEGIEAVRVSGLTNMLARDVVEGLARRLGFPATAEWIRENQALYARGVFHGFEATE